MSSQSSTLEIMHRVILLDRINCLVSFDQTGRGADEAMALMTRHGVTAAECNARRMDGNRPHYRPVSLR